MEESTNDKKKKGISKGIIALIVGVLVLAGGTAAAFILMKSSPKSAYFLAEKDTMDFVVEQIENRYQPEFDWYEKTQNEKTASTLELSAEYNDPAAASTGYGMDPMALINNSSITIDSQSDIKNKQLSAALKANIAGMEINDFHTFITNEKVMVGLPFLEETLQLKDEDFGPLLHEADPEMFTGKETLELDQLFESAGGTLPEEDLEYLEDEYLKLIYDELPEKAFSSSNESVEVDGESIDAEKIVLSLSEEQVKNIITTIFDKMEKDDRLKEMIKEQMLAQQFGGAYMEEEVNTFITDFETGIANAKEELADFQIPDGLTSTLWIADKKVVQRDFSVEMGPSAEELVLFTVKGTQLFTESKQFFNYDLAFADSVEEGSMNISGDLNWKDNQGTDSISLSVEDVVISYEGSETLNDGTREFDRTFSFEDPTSGGGSLLWSGNASYEKDQMNAEHNFSLETPGLSQDMFTLNLVTDGKTIDSIEAPSEDNVKDIGSMNATELQEYFELEVTPSFEQWLFGLMSSGGMGY